MTLRTSCKTCSCSYRKLQGLDNPEVFRHWAFRIATRAAFRHLRKRRHLPLHVDEDALDHMADPAPPPVDGAALLVLLGAVSPASRAVREIPLGTVRSRLAYGLSMLRKLLADKDKS